MTQIGELFAKLGFKTDTKGAKEFSSSIDNIKNNLNNLKKAFFVYEISRFVNSMINSTVQLKNFNLQTGLSIRKLQEWQYYAKINDVSNQELASSLQGIQRAQKEVLLGHGNIRPFALLGISAKEDPFVVLDQLSKKAKTMSPAMLSLFSSQMGVSQNLLNIFRSQNIEFSKLHKNLLLNEEEYQKILSLNRNIKDLIFIITQTMTKFLALFAEPLNKAVNLVRNLSLFTFSLIKGISHLAEKFIAVKIALAGIATVIGTIALATSPLTAGLIGIILLLDDIVGYFTGRYTNTFTGDFINQIKKLGKIFKDAFDPKQIFIDFLDFFKNLIDGMLKLVLGLTKKIKEIYTIENFKKGGGAINEFLFPKDKENSPHIIPFEILRNLIEIIKDIYPNIQIKEKLQSNIDNNILNKNSSLFNNVSNNISNNNTFNVYETKSPSETAQQIKNIENEKVNDYFTRLATLPNLA